LPIVKRDLPIELVDLLSRAKEGTTLLEVASVFLILVLERNNGNRTRTSEELKIPLRTLRNRIWQLESLGYDVPEPRNTKGGFEAFKKCKTNKPFVKKTKQYDL
jgi:hypothetical protein